METTKLKKFAQQARVTLIEQVATKLKFVRAEESLARRENPIAVKKLEDLIKQQSEQEVVERIAYIWFNRFCALRFMDMNRYNRSLVVSAAAEDTQPEVLALAKAGDIDERVVPEAVREQILNLLNGRAPSQNPEAEVYRLLLVAYCNQWHESMPFLFQRIDDYTELLMPDDLLSSSSVLTDMREAMPEEACEDVEVIGWLYQFYISDKKDDVFARLKKNEKVTPENIPAATQLFTPHWIVRYLVENSLGRLWLLNHPESKLADSMEYYIKPAADNDDSDYLKVARPEDLKICDPACGSGHMLTYAFDLLYAIYEEQGYGAADIPSLILTHNLYGIEIDERAGELAAFALTMKARARHRRFFNTDVRPNICVLEPISFDDDELDEYMDFIGRDLFTADLEETLRQFDEVDNFGSLIRPALTDVTEILKQLEATDVSGQLFLGNTHQKVLKLLKQADYLSPQYHVVVANPPYMTSGGMNTNLKEWSDKNYRDSKSDLYSMFIERCTYLVSESGYVGMVTMQSWMYLKTFYSLRDFVLRNTTIHSLLHLGANAFPEIKGERVQVSAFILEKSCALNNHTTTFFRLIAGNSSEKEQCFLGNENRFAPIKQQDFQKLEDLSLAYKMLSMPSVSSKLLAGEVVDCSPSIGSQPGSNLIDMWWEKSHSTIGERWRKYNKGGIYRKWYGNAIWVVDYGSYGENITNAGGQLTNQHLYGKKHISWTRVSSNLNLRYYDEEVFFDNTSPAIVDNIEFLLAYFNSKVGEFNRLGKFSGTKIEAGHIRSIAPLSPENDEMEIVNRISSSLVELGRSDWNSYETSWDFRTFSMLDYTYRQKTVEESYEAIRENWLEMTESMQRLEIENNQIFIDAYGLQDELTPEVPLKEITLTCNPYYRYGGDKTDDELEALLLADTMRELISYAVGCMFGRYSLDKPGLILANQGDKIEQYFEQIPDPSFMPDKNNVIPILDDGWFSDDIVERFRKFIKVAFGEAQYESNMQFIELALGKNDKPRDIRDYFLKDFYNDHVKRYKKRPIYWLFTSGNFNALIYMHRYQPDTVSIVLNDYLREFRTKLNAYKDQLSAINISASQSQSEKTKAQKKLDITNKMITEMEEYERDVLYPLATKQIEIDLDDGVKVNYPKFGTALKKVTGLS